MSSAVKRHTTMEALGEATVAINMMPRAAYRGCKNPIAAGFAARGAGLGKICLGAAAPVVLMIGAVPNPAGMVFAALAGPLIAVPTVIWGVGDLLVPELFYKRKY